MASPESGDFRRILRTPRASSGFLKVVLDVLGRVRSRQDSLGSSCTPQHTAGTSKSSGIRKIPSDYSRRRRTHR
eukprot:526660-Pyramimonas_sp.AAC.1